MAKRVFKAGDWNLLVKRSNAGLGLFAGEDLPKNACLIEYVGRTVSKEEETSSKSKYLFQISKNKTIDGKPRWNKAGYINHACDGAENCETDIKAGRVYVFAIKSIKKGEELTYDYGEEYFNDHIKPFGCRCAKHTDKPFKK